MKILLDTGHDTFEEPSAPDVRMPPSRIYGLLLSACLAFGAPVAASAQQSSFVRVATDLTCKTLPLPRQREICKGIEDIASNENIRIVRLDIAALKNDATISIPLADSGGFVVIKNNSREFHGEDNFAWFGADANGSEGDATIVVNGRNVTGSFHAGKDLYRLQPLTDGLHALTRVNMGRLPADHPPSFYKENRGGFLMEPKDRRTSQLLSFAHG